MGYANGRIIAASVIVAVSMTASVVVELRHHDPMLDLRLFQSRSFSAISRVSAATMFGFVGIALLTVLYLSKARGMDALSVGFRLLPLFITYMVISALVSRLVRRIGFRIIMTIGLVLMAGRTLALIWTSSTSGYSHVWPGLLLAGIGFGLLGGPSTAAAVNSVPTGQVGTASSSLNMFRQLGSVLGPSVLGTIVTSHFASLLAARPGAGTGGNGEVSAARISVAFTDSVHLGLLVGALMVLAVAFPTAAFVRGPQRHH